MHATTSHSPVNNRVENFESVFSETYHTIVEHVKKANQSSEEAHIENSDKSNIINFDHDTQSTKEKKTISAIPVYEINSVVPPSPSSTAPSCHCCSIHSRAPRRTQSLQ
jgi:hypothetical protein